MTVKLHYKDANEALNDYKYSDDKSIIERVEKCSFNNQRENADIINEIVLWKINRVTSVPNDLIVEIKVLSKIVKRYQDVSSNIDQIKKVYERLITDSTGVKAAMASTILKMFMPEALPIIDQRAFREIYRIPMPKVVDGSLYLDYVEKVIKQYEIDKVNCPSLNFFDMDKVLYQRDKAAGNKVDY